MMTLTDETLFQYSDIALVLFFIFLNIHWFGKAAFEVLMNLLCTTVVLPLSKKVDDCLNSH